MGNGQTKALLPSKGHPLDLLKFVEGASWLRPTPVNHQMGKTEQ